MLIFPLQAGMITDPESNTDQVMEFVGGLMARLEGLHKKAFTYKSYQKNFKVVLYVVCDLTFLTSCFRHINTGHSNS